MNTNFTSKITQVCQDICDIKLRQLLVTQSDKKTIDITSNILTNQSDCKDIWDSNTSRSGTQDRHEDVRGAAYDLLAPGV